MTPQELYDNYEYKVTAKVLKREYPWILNVGLEENRINEYNLIFIDVYFDPFMVRDEYGWGLASWLQSAIQDGREYTSPYLSTGFKCTYEEGKEVSREIEDTIKDIHKSPALPYDLKLPGTRQLAVGRWLVPAHYKEHYGIPEANPEDTPQLSH
jgi:hypothetical protein